LNSSYISALILLALFAGLLIYDRKVDTEDLYASIHAEMVELQSDAEGSRSLWPSRVTNFDSRVEPRMDVWPKDRWYSFAIPYLWDGMSGEEMEISIVGEAMATGVVLGIDTYHEDFQTLSPVDVAIGWGDFITPEWLSELRVSFGNRRVQAFSPDLFGHLTNMHIIPGSPDFNSALRKLSKGDRLALRGYAVRVKPHRKWKAWNSDLHFGDEKCEILIVTEIYVEDENGTEKMSLSIDDYEAVDA
jgi:hypothetical protein